MNIAYRKGDVIRFRRGSNEYLGKIYKTPVAMRGCIVTVDTGDELDRGAWAVQWKSVVRIEVPVLTAKERAALVALWSLSRRGRVGRSIADLKSQGHAISGTTMNGLAQRGLVVGERLGVATASGPMYWRVTTEGRRVARAL